MNEDKLTKLLNKTDLIRFKWSDINLWNVKQLYDKYDRAGEHTYILDKGHKTYNKKEGIYLYHLDNNEYKLIAVIKGDFIYDTIK